MDTNNNQFPDERQESTSAPTYTAPATPVASQPAYTPPITPEKSKKWPMWALPLALLVIAGLVAAGYYLGTQQRDDKQANTATTSDSIELRDTKEQDKDDAVAEPVDSYAGWQSSNDIALGGPAPTFSFKYPGSWKHVMPGEGVSCGIMVSPTATRWTFTDSIVCVGTDGTDNRSIEDVAISWLGNDGPVASSKTLTVSGRPAVQVTSKPQADGDKTRIGIVTIVSDVNRGNGYSDPIGILQVSTTFVGSQNEFDAFQKEYQLIVESVEVK